MTKKIIKLISILLAVLLVIYLGFQIYNTAYPAYRIEVAIISAVEDNVSATGIVVRDETVIESYTGDGVCHYLVANGEKVGKGSAVAEVFATPQDALDALSLEILREELDLLQQIEAGNRTSGSNPSAISARIDRLLSEVAVGLKQNRNSRLTAWRMQLLELLNSYTLARGGQVNAAARIAEIEARIAQLASRNLTPIRIITTPMDGYFIASADGLETIDKGTAAALSVARLDKIIQAGETPTAGCKVVSAYDWYYAAVIDQKDAVKFKVGAALSLDFGYAGITELPVKVVDVTSDQELGKAKVILECTRFDTALAGLRQENAKIRFNLYSGIVIGRSALHMKESQLGVFIKYGNTVAFRSVDPVYNAEDFIVSRVDNPKSGQLAQYEEIIVSGRDLFEGKRLG